MSISNRKVKDQIMVASAIDKIKSRPCTKAQSAWLLAHGASTDELEHLTVTAASAKIRLIIADRQPSPQETNVVERDLSEPTDAQIELMRRIGVAAEAILELDQMQASDLIDHKLAELGRKRDEARAKSPTASQVDLLVKRGLDEESARALTRGQASDAIAQLVRESRKRQ